MIPGRWRLSGPWLIYTPQELKQKGVAYIHVNELAGLFCRELFTAPTEDHWVMFMKKLPSVKTVLRNDSTRSLPGGDLDSGLLSFTPGDFPMIEKILHLDLGQEKLEACRSFSLEKDLWITDHLEIGEMRCFRKVGTGEKIMLEARLRTQTDEVLTWDTRGLDDQGETLMQISGLQMKWISD